jgi:beta-glucosidase
MKLPLPPQSPLILPDFTFGVATAAFQIEGASHDKGRVPSIWDTFCDTPGKVFNGDNGHIACDHFNRMDADLDLIQSLQFDAYRFSVAWPRVQSAPGKWNPIGMDFYDRLVDGLLTRGIKPHVTLYHWDLPQFFEDTGGWLNRDIVPRFVDYADKVTRRLGDRVTAYATLNEPWCSAYLGYRWGIHAPGKTSDADGFLAMHHLLLAHGSAIPVMRENAPAAAHGIVLNFTPAYPATDSAADQRAAAQCDDENSHCFASAVFAGRYPTSVQERHPDWWPEFPEEDLAIISTPLDFLGVNFYTRQVVRATSDIDFEPVPQPQAEHTDIGWEIYPDALTHVLTDLHTRYTLPPIYITENGAAGADSINEQDQVIDDQRCRYYASHLNAVDRAMMAGVNIKGYFAWSLMDNFEWAEGYNKRFGIVYVDYVSQRRLPKQSALMFKDFLTERQ